MNIYLQQFIKNQMLSKKHLNEGVGEKIFKNNISYISKSNWVENYQGIKDKNGRYVKLENGIEIFWPEPEITYPKKSMNEEEVSAMNENDDLLTEDELFEDDVNEANEPKPMSEEELKIESLKIATNIAKLMSDVTTDDIITIADKVSGFIRDHQIGSDESKSEESDVANDLELPSDESEEEPKEENSEE